MKIHKPKYYRFKNFLFIPVIIIFLLAIIWLADWIYGKTPQPKVEYGITFSTMFAQQLKLDPMEVYQNIVDDLKIKQVRIPLYWDTIEKKPNQYNFEIYDKLFDLSSKKNIKIMPVIGYKVPRWPECFAPNYTQTLSSNEFKNQVLKTLQAEVNRYKSRPEVIAWQIENEPMLNFGVCRKLGKDFLKTEVDLVKKLDSRKVIITDSGERGYWITAMSSSDIMGTTLYRSVWDKNFGLLNYPLPSIYYPLRAYFTKLFFAPGSQGILISELQAEPWPSNGKNILETPIEEQINLLSLDYLKNIVDFAKRTHIKKQYFWGAEWWYWMRTQGHPEYWEYAKNLF